MAIGLLAFGEIYGSSWVKGLTMTLTFSQTNLRLLIKTTLIPFLCQNLQKFS